jgi:threonylcarbamoyladenosine tRNA methylthiotransferase MtaB
MRIALYTLGCKLNQCETEAICSVLKQKQYTIVTPSQKAAMYIINTCTVTSKSDQKTRRFVRSCLKKNRNAVVIVTGCYAQLNPEDCAGIHPHIIVVPHDNKDKLLEFFSTTDPGHFSYLSLQEKLTALRDFIKKHQEKPFDPFAFVSTHFQSHSRAFLKIQDGCDNRCVYCRVPLARGRSVSLEPEKVLHRIRCIENAGYAEIVLTGVNISAYYYSGKRIHELLKIILNEKRRARFRLSSLEPETIDPELTAILAHPGICPHFHLPVQSGSDRILATMKRRYNAGKIEEVAGLLRKARPDCFLGADILTGFPGELDTDHHLTMDLVNRCGFSALHVFQFSPRPGTTAFSFEQDIPARVKKKRSQELLALSEKLSRDYHHLWKEKEVDVVLEKKTGSSKENSVTFSGLSGNYLRLQVTDIPGDQARRGILVRCRILEPGNPGTAVFLAFV